MYDLQKDWHECMSQFGTAGWEWYCPDRWVPHCTVSLTVEDPERAFFEAADLVLHEFKRMQGTFKSVGLVKITFPVKELYTVELAQYLSLKCRLYSILVCSTDNRITIGGSVTKQIAADSIFHYLFYHTI